MNNKGFTLVEVITVIAILSVIVLIAVPSYFGITDSLRQREYDNKVKQIEVKATEWATDNNITEDTTITIARLVDEGYVNMDDETSVDKRVINPLNKESMECYHVEIKVSNTDYKTKVKESTDCELKILEEQEKNIKVVGYEIDSNTNTILSSEELKMTGNELEWSGKDVLLVTNGLIEEYSNPKSITYSSGSTSEEKKGLMYNGVFKAGDRIDNIESYQNLYIVSASVILKSKYTITYELETERPRKTVLVKIDKENPNGSYSMLEKWGKSETKKVLLSGSDGAGSGVKGFYISETNDIGRAEYKEAVKNEVTIEKKMGTYYYWVEDKVGNRSLEGNVLNVTNIDDIAPECKYTGMNSKWTKDPVTITYGCSDNESGCTTPKKSVTFSSGVQTSFKIPEYEIRDAAGNVTKCGGEVVDVYFDSVAPHCEISKDHLDTADGVTISVVCDDKYNGSNVSGLENDPTKDYPNQKESRSFTAKDKAGNTTTVSMDVEEYTVYRKRDAVTCTYNTTWNNCKTGSNTCKAGCGSSKDLMPSYAICVAECPGGCVSEDGSTYCVRSTGCSDCYTGSNTCQGGWNTETKASASHCGWLGWGAWGEGNYCATSDTCDSESTLWYR